MNSFPMLVRCNHAQWRGLTPEERYHIISDWEMLGSQPGGVYYPTIGHRLYMLWYVEHPNHSVRSGDILLSIKIDSWPMGFEKDGEA